MTKHRSMYSQGERPVSTALPLPIDRLLDVMVDRATEAGFRTTRKEVVATALFSLANATGEEIGELLIGIRTADISDIPEE